MNIYKYKINLFNLIPVSLQALIILGISLSGEVLKAQTLPLSSNLIDLNSLEGNNLLLESEARQDYFPLSSQFVTQKNGAFCGVASIVMVLNALSIPAPKPPVRNYHFFNQDNFFDNPRTLRIMTADNVARRGMTLEQLGQLLESYPVNAEVYHGGYLTLDRFRRLITNNLQQPNDFVLINYLRSSIGQKKGGHISPIAAYDGDSDRFLILDVSRYKYPPVWVKAEELWQATRTIDRASGKTRGLVLVSTLEDR